MSIGSGERFVGSCKRVIADRGFCFLEMKGGPDLFCHVRDMDPNIPFDETLTARRLEFSIEQSDKGPRAVRVRAAT